jgi:hypothetical protein
LARNLLDPPDPVRRFFPLLFTAALLFTLASALSGCPGTIEDASRFTGRCREPIDVQTEIFLPRCGDSICHDAQTPEGNLDLISPNVERRLVGVRATQCTERQRIDPSNPELSFLLEKLERDDPECGDRMPVHDQPLSRNEIACVREWVEELAAGAITDAGGDQ